MHAETHPSEPNYLALFSGGTQGVRDDNCPLMFDVPTRLGPRMPPDHWAAPAVEHFDRALVVATLVYVALRWCRLTLRTDEGPRTKDQGLRV